MRERERDKDREREENKSEGETLQRKYTIENRRLSIFCLINLLLTLMFFFPAFLVLSYFGGNV